MNQVKTMSRGLAVAMILGAAAVIAWGAMDGSEVGTSIRWATWPAGVTLIVVGASMWWAGRLVGGVQDGRILNRNGFGGMMQQAMATHGPSRLEGGDGDLIGNAQIIGVRDTGVTISNLNAVFELRCLVTVTGRAPYEATMRVALGRAQWGSLQPGMTVPVRVDAGNPSKIALDASRPVVLSGGAAQHSGGMPGGVPTMTMPGGGTAQVSTVKAADIASAGVKVTGVLQQVAPTGMTAGQVAGGLPLHEADDPVVHAVFVFDDGSGSSHRCESLFRVPDGKGQYLVPGNPIPVAFLPNDPTRATIDFSRLA